jgi:hypothetical protein
MPLSPRPRAALRALLPCAALVWAASCLNVSPPGPTFASEPPGARVHVDGRDSGWVTPCQIALDPDDTHAVTIAMEGYAPRELLLVPQERLAIVDWLQGVNGVRSTIRFPILLPTWDLLMPLREIHALAPGRVYVRLRPAEAQ